MATPFEFFKSKLQYEIDVMDVADGLRAGEFVLVDTRRRASWDHAHIPGSLHLPSAEITTAAPHHIPLGSRVVVYSWGPGCNGSTVGALAFAELKYPVREMIGGIEYWIRNGLPVETADGLISREVDPLVRADRRP
ncbi:rhodanese-related sulfurtransferase [Pseudarthrobacter siccitolerans]|uniref:Rhodanese-related sulfurtransferase n=1 Tax=Pseudarthrobacter siccitolerans TaxID=861266 RepID=A0ABU0PL67_9MICC|nr:rhodanese-like domain-containing protein [Pseudarthrobacter siccitolerans]MDQ0674437.1 rhodanese-related sulfurtransferase [Pseudarthrobacter siccitolerans]